MLKLSNKDFKVATIHEIEANTFEMNEKIEIVSREKKLQKIIPIKNFKTERYDF